MHHFFNLLGEQFFGGIHIEILHWQPGIVSSLALSAIYYYWRYSIECNRACVAGSYESKGNHWIVLRSWIVPTLEESWVVNGLINMKFVVLCELPRADHKVTYNKNYSMIITQILIEAFAYFQSVASTRYVTTYDERYRLEEKSFLR